MNYKKDNILEYFIQQLQKQLGKHLKQIILFGSRARGDNAPDSDYDCLLILDETSRLINDIIDEIAGETLCAFLEKTDSKLTIHRPRLPRIATDQTVTLFSVSNQDPVPLMLENLRCLRDA